MKWKSLLPLCGVLIVVGFPAYAVGLKGIRPACLRVERVAPGYGVTHRDIDAYAFAWLKARVFKREPDADLGCLPGSAEIRVAVVLNTLDFTRVEYYALVAVIVARPTAEGWRIAYSKSLAFTGKGEARPRVRSTLDTILSDFAAAYLAAGN